MSSMAMNIHAQGVRGGGAKIVPLFRWDTYAGVNKG